MMWLETLFEKLFSFIPRMVIMRPDEGGFRSTPKPWGGTWLTSLNPGNWYFLWPVLMEEECCKIKTQVKDIRTQSVWTSDGYDVIVGVSVRYYVRDWMKALLDVYDYDESIQTVALTVACKYMREKTLIELKTHLEDMRDELLKAVRDASKGWGLYIQEVGITDIGRARNFRLLMGNTNMEI